MTELNSRLIDQLSHELAPVTPVHSIFKRWLKIAVFLLVVSVFSVFYYGVRPNLNAQLLSIHFYIETIALAFIVFAGLHAALTYSMPGAPRGRYIPFIAVFGLLWLGMLLLRLNGVAAGTSWVCVIMVTSVNVLPIIYGLRQFKGLRVFDKRHTVLCLSLGSAVVGGLAIQFICPADHSAHLLVWHGLPVLATLIIVGVLGFLIIKEA